ncbi:MAG: TRAP transporter small permease subunit [Desulfobacteraceae bacterium]|nr:MAG: TRAP transporter small permease subunit [Desulfobacteraceae bacterium]
MPFLEKYVRFVDGLNDRVGSLMGWLCTVMVLTVFYDVIMRYGFNQGSIAVQEMEWHLFAIIFLVGAAYTLKEDGHVRVDILYLNFSERTKAWVDLIGTLVFLIPFALVVIYSTKNFILNSWAVREMSPDPGGLPARYVLKAMIPLGFSLLILQGISQAAKKLMVITGYRMEDDQ